MTGFSVPTRAARARLSEIMLKVQDPRSYCILTRHGHPVAAVVSIAELRRIWHQQDVDDIVTGKKRPSYFRFGKGGFQTNAEAAEAIQQLQLDRRMEREVLATAGLDVIPGGELQAETAPVTGQDTGPDPTEPATPRRRWWQCWRATR